MADRYTFNLPKPLAVDTPQMRAAVNLVLAVKKGEAPDADSLKVLSDAFFQIFGGTDPTDLFGAPLGLVHPPHRPKGYGFTKDDIVSAFIELRRRALLQSQPRRALQAAKEDAAYSFEEYGPDTADAERDVERRWRNGRATVAALSDDDLRMILEPYKIT